MSTPRNGSAFPWVGIFVLGAACVAAAWAMSSVPTKMKQADRMNRDLAKLRALAAQHDPLLKAVAAAQSAAVTEPASLETILDAALPGVTREIRSVDAPATGVGVALVAKEVVLADADLSALSAVILAGEAATPPWRVAECTVVPSDRSAGKGRITLVLETVKREGSS